MQRMYKVQWHMHKTGTKAVQSVTDNQLLRNLLEADGNARNHVDFHGRRSNILRCGVAVVAVAAVA